MRKTVKGGYRLTLHLDKDTAEFILQFAELDCRSPENMVKSMLTKQVRKMRGDKDGKS